MSTVAPVRVRRPRRPRLSPLVMLDDDAALTAFAARLLDHYRPDWAWDVNVQTLRMESCRLCVLGQAFGDYATGMRALYGGKIRRVIVRHPEAVTFMGLVPTALWINEILTRRT